MWRRTARLAGSRRLVRSRGTMEQINAHIGREPSTERGDGAMKGLLIKKDEFPREIDIEVNEDGSALRSLQGLVGGNIDAFDVLFDDGVSLYINEEGLFTCPPNRAIFATEHMEQAGFLSQMDYSHVVQKGELYTVLHGDIVAVGFDCETGADRDLTADEMRTVKDYFTDVSRPGSGFLVEYNIYLQSHGHDPIGSFDDLAADAMEASASEPPAAPELESGRAEDAR